MKTTIKIFALGLLLSCAACGAKKSTQSTMEKNQQEMTADGSEAMQGDMAGDNSSVEDQSTDTTEDMAQAGTESAGAETDSDMAMTAGNPAVTPTKKMDYLDMYSQLEMTDAQIQQFEGALTDFHTQQQNMPSGEMMGSLSDERDRQLKEILSDEQFSAYESWKESD